MFRTVNRHPRPTRRRRAYHRCRHLTGVPKSCPSRRSDKAVIWALNKERLINSGFYDLATAYQSVHVNY